MNDRILIITFIIFIVFFCFAIHRKPNPAQSDSESNLWCIDCSVDANAECMQNNHKCQPYGQFYCETLEAIRERQNRLQSDWKTTMNGIREDNRQFQEASILVTHLQKQLQQCMALNKSQQNK